jgi:hypothetical protein
MAESPSHQFGQIIGDMLEVAVKPLLNELAQKYDLYLDSKGLRSARKGNKKVSWYDLFGNKHDLDFVFEKGGTFDDPGTPLAFIEVAWRRYTKHSKNKVQEIEGAILPLVTTHQTIAPFIGVILAGEFTASSLKQLQSRNFTVLHFPYDSVITAFSVVEIDAYFDEVTPDNKFAKQILVWKALDEKQQLAVAEALINSNSLATENFIQSLELFLNRQISSISVLPLHGNEISFVAINEAVDFINSYDQLINSLPLVKYEVVIRYNNGSRINGQFVDKISAIEFLRGYEPPSLKIVT